jgi:hypothetical protein
VGVLACRRQTKEFFQGRQRRKESRSRRGEGGVEGKGIEEKDAREEEGRKRERERRQERKKCLKEKRERECGWAQVNEVVGVVLVVVMKTREDCAALC